MRRVQLVGARQAADGTKAQNPRRTGSEAETKIPALVNVTFPGMDRNRQKQSIREKAGGPFQPDAGRYMSVARWWKLEEPNKASCTVA